MKLSREKAAALALLALALLLNAWGLRAELYAGGFDFICYSGDVWVLQNALAQAMTALREGVAAKRS